MSPAAPRRRRWFGATWVFGVLVLAAVVSTVVSRGQITDVVRALRHVQVTWLLIAIALQASTYVIAAGIWRVALARQGERRSLTTLVPLALAMLFSNQAVPSVGLSGGLLVEEALARRGTPRPVAMAALLLGLLSTYGALIVSLVFALLWLGLRGAASPITLAIAAAFTLFAAGVSAGIFEARRLASSWQRRLLAWPGVGPAIVAAAAAPPDVMRAPALLATLTAMQLAEIVLDAATLGVSLYAVGVVVSPGAVFSSYILAATGSRVAFAPLGLGTFEAASVLMLHGRGVALEEALAATLVFRGLTLWLPMLPGLWCARRALR